MPLVSKNFSDIITFTRASGATWFNSAGNLIGVDFSTSSNTIGTGSKTFTLNTTAGVDRSWATGDTVLIVDQANSANNMTGAVTSYTASTQALVVNVTSTAGSGTITSWRVGNLMQRLDYNPSTLAAQGLLIEEARTNSIRNNTMQGAVAGTPGTAPTNWSVGVNGSGLTIQLVGTGTENGINYIDYRFSGTTASAVEFFIQPEAGTAVSASNGQTWTGSFYVRAVAGSIANINYARAVTRGVNNVGVGLTIGVGADVKSSLSVGSISGLRAGATVTTADATTFAAQTYFACGHGSGVAIDITLRIGLPQLEQGAFATSVIPTTTTALTRSADVASVNTLSPWFNATEGTVYAEFSTFATTTGFGGAWGFGDNTLPFANAEAIYVARTNATNSTAQTVIDNGVSQGAISSGSGVAPNTVGKVASTYKLNDVAVSVNAAAVGVDTTVTIPTVTGLSLGSLQNAWSGGGNFLNGYLRRITYYPRRLSNAELVSITT